MKKIYFVIGGAIIAAALVTFGAVNWNAKIKTASESAKEKIEMVKKTDPHLTGDAPLDSNGTAAADGQAGGDETSSDGGKNGNGISSDPSTNDESLASSVKAPALSGTSLEEIKAAYEEIFTELEIIEGSKIDQLVVQAKADYVSGKYSKEDLAVKYQETARSLEAKADQAFQTIYKQLELDLEKNGHDVSEAGIFKKEYERKKNERLMQVVEKVAEF